MFFLKVRILPAKIYSQEENTLIHMKLSVHIKNDINLNYNLTLKGMVYARIADLILNFSL